jgi:hypothetical protein
MLAHMLARAVDGADFRLSREWVGCRARSARAWEGDRAPAQSFRRLRVSGHNHACSHSGAGGRRGRFSAVEKRQWERVGCRARSARVREGDCATARAFCKLRRFCLLAKTQPRRPRHCHTPGYCHGSGSPARPDPEALRSPGSAGALPVGGRRSEIDRRYGPDKPQRANSSYSDLRR